jgi:hypothetical protein
MICRIALAQAALRRVVAAVGRRVRLDVLGRHRRPGEDVVVVEVGPVQDLRADRVEEGLGEFGLLVVDQAADVEQLELAARWRRRAKRRRSWPQQLGGLADPLVVGTDAPANGGMDALPVSRLEEQFGLLTVGPDQLIVPVEAIDHRLGNALGEHVFNSRDVHEPACPPVG